MKVLVIFALLLLGFQTTAQDKLIDKLDAVQNSILKEKVFIHTNKTSYRSDDTIWFKAYVSDAMNRPSLRSTKLYVNLINRDGIAIYKKTLFIEEGIGFGQFELDDAVAPGNYYIQAYTNYMRNFGSEYHHLLEIVILGEVPQRAYNKKEDIYDVQLLPEGGYLLEGVKNTIAIKALMNGQEVDFSGDIRNDKGESIVSFKNEHLGMTKCKLLYPPGEIYTAAISFKDTILNVKVPLARKTGIVFQVDATSDTNYAKVSLKTNTATFKNKNYSNYSLLSYQNHQIFDFIPLTRFDSLTGKIRLKKSRFAPGVNTITLFHKDAPIAERKFFIEKEQKNPTIGMEKLENENDSVAYRLKIRDLKDPAIANLSVSVLPLDSKALHEKQNMLSAFLLTPFLKGHVENPAYYFDVKNKKRKEHLDLLLLTQGWSKYNLEEMIRDLSPLPKYQFEHGFELKGKVADVVPYDSIALIRDNYQTFDQVALKEDASFIFKNLLLYKGDTTQVSFIDKTGKIIAPKKIDYEQQSELDNPHPRIPMNLKYYSSNKQLQGNSFANKEPLAKTEKDGNSSAIVEGTILLDEAIVKEKKRSQSYLERRKMIRKYKPIVSDIGRYYDIPIPELFLKYNHDLLNYLKAQGIRVIDDNPLDIHYVNPASREVIVVVDGRLLPAEALSGFPLRMKEVENVLVSNSGNIEGRLVFGEIYQVFTKKKFGNRVRELFNQHRVKNGYDRHEKYYTPFYDSGTPINTEYLDLDWKSNLSTNKNGEVIFKISSNRKTSGLLFSIQGFSSEGHLISQTIPTD